MMSSLVAPQLFAQGGYYQDYNRRGGYYIDNSIQGTLDRGRASDGTESGRTVGGTVGMAAGMAGGAALAAAGMAAAGITAATWGPMAMLLIGSAAVVTGGFAGGKLFSHLGGKLTASLGRDNLWMMMGAAAGAIAAIALLGVAGPFAAAGGLVLKGVIGAVVGGTIGKLFAPQLEALATPRVMMMGLGALVGGLGGGISGAIVGGVSGYAMGSIVDDHFFSQPGDSFANYLPFGGGGVGNITDKLKDSWARLTDWGAGKRQDSREWWDDNYHRNQQYDPVFQQTYQMARGQSYDSPWDYQYQSQGQYYAPSNDYGQRVNDRNQAYQNFMSGARNGDFRGYEQYRVNQGAVQDYRR